MSDQSQGNTNPEHPRSLVLPIDKRQGNSFTLSLGGYLFIFISLVAFGTDAYISTFVGPAEKIPEVFQGSVIGTFLFGYLPHIIVLLIGLICAALGVRLLKASGAAYIRVIPPDDYPVLANAIATGKSESIDQYVRLSSLTGFTGGFTKLGLTGLPFTTVALTIIFSLLSIYDKGSFLDFAKLTLGAFIGSFVQRQVERTAPAPAGSPGDAGKTGPTSGTGSSAGPALPV